jgi:hypothetical protein
MIAKVAILQRDNGVEPRKNDLNHANHLLHPIKTAMVVLQQLILVWPTAATVDNSPGKSWKMLLSHVTLATSAKWHMSSFLMLLRDGSGLRVSCNIGEISSRTNVGVNVKEAAFRNPTPVSGTLWFDEYDLSAKEAKSLTPRFRRTPSTSQCPDRDILRRIVPSARISLSSSGSTRPERVPTVRPIIRKLRVRFVGVDWNANTAVTIVPVNLSQRSRHNITVTKMKLTLVKICGLIRDVCCSREASRFRLRRHSVSDRGRYPPLYAIDVDRSIWHADVWCWLDDRWILWRVCVVSYYWRSQKRDPNHDY